MVETVGVVGLGLIGGSMAKAIHQYTDCTLLGYDLDGAVLAVAAADERAVNHQAAMLCRARGIPVSTADCAEESTFFFPAVCAGDGLTAGLVSVDGNHKKVRETAVKIRKLLSGGAE